MKTIETIGVPGSGKSTVNNLLLRKYKGTVFSTEQLVVGDYFKNYLLQFLLRKKFSRILTNNFYEKKGNELLGGFLLENKVLYDDIIGSESFSKQSKEDKVFVLKWLFQLFIDYQYSTRRIGGYFLIDEGFIHKAISLFVNPSGDRFGENNIPFNSELEKYLSRIPLPTFLIHIEIDIEKAFERLKKRGFTQRTKHLNEFQTFKYLHDCDKVIRYMVQFMEERNCHIIHLNNDIDLKGLKRKINQDIKLY